MIFSNLRQKTTRTKYRGLLADRYQSCALYRQYDCQWITRQGRPVENVNSTRVSGGVGEGDFSLYHRRVWLKNHIKPLFSDFTSRPINNEKSTHTQVYNTLYIYVYGLLFSLRVDSNKHATIYISVVCPVLYSIIGI